MGNYYNAAGDLLVTAYACMKQGKTTKALECAELALQTPEMNDIVIGLKQLNAVAADEIEDDEEIEIDESCGDEPEEEIEDEELEVEESSDDDDEEVEVDEDEESEEEVEDACGKECASADDEDSEDDEDDDEEVEVDEEEEEEIDEAKLDKVLCSLRKQYNVTSSIKKPSTLSSKLKALASKAGK